MSHQKKGNLFEIDEHIQKRFDIHKRLGKGAYGVVWKVVDRKTREVIALKKIFDAFRNQTDAQRTFREIMFLQSLKNHPNIVKLHSIHRAANNSDIYLGFEYMETDLHNVIKKGILKDIHRRYIMYQLFKAIKYIHSGNVIHRDLKPSNILVDVMCRCKIADFGLARSLSITDGSLSDTDPTLTDYVATRWYRAPEILIANRRYTKGIDIWSLGCILAEMLGGKPIFPGTSTVNQIERIMATIPSPSQEDIRTICASPVSSSMIRNASSVTKIPIRNVLGKEIAKDALSLINKLLVFNPNKRLTAEEALEHHYVSKFHNPNEETILTEDIIIPFNDDIRLSVEDYRNKLYEIMSNHKSLLKNDKPTIIKLIANQLRIQKSKNEKTPNNKCQNQRTLPETKVSSKPKINLPTTTTTTTTTIGCINNNKSDTKVITKQQIIFQTPKTVTMKSTQRPNIVYTNSKVGPIKSSTTINNDKKKTINNNNNNNNSNNIYHNHNHHKSIINGKLNSTIFNNYNQTHGVVNRSTLVELRAAGLR